MIYYLTSNISDTIQNVARHWWVIAWLYKHNIYTIDFNWRKECINWTSKKYHNRERMEALNWFVFKFWASLCFRNLLTRKKGHSFENSSNKFFWIYINKSTLHIVYTQIRVVNTYWFLDFNFCACHETS